MDESQPSEPTLSHEEQIKSFVARVKANFHREPNFVFFRSRCELGAGYYSFINEESGSKFARHIYDADGYPSNATVTEVYVAYFREGKHQPRLELPKLEKTSYNIFYRDVIREIAQLYKQRSN